MNYYDNDFNIDSLFQSKHLLRDENFDTSFPNDDISIFKKQRNINEVSMVPQDVSFSSAIATNAQC